MSSRPFSLQVSVADGPPDSVSGEVSAAEVELLEEFLEHVARLEQTAFVASAGRARLSVRWSIEAGLQVESDLPDRTVFAEFVLELRPFLLQSEDTQFFKILGIFGRHFTHPQLRHALRILSDLYSGKRMASVVKVTAGDRQIMTDEFVLDWMNAFEYHRVRRKRAEIEELHQAAPLETTEALVVQLLIEKANAIRQLGRLADACLRGGGSSATITTD
jgi:hypothetical protein